MPKLFSGSSVSHELTRTEHWNYFSPEWQSIMEILWDFCLGVAPGWVPVPQASARGFLVWGPGSLCDSVWSPVVVSFGLMACSFVVWTEGKVAEYWCLSKAFLYEEGEVSSPEVCHNGPRGPFSFSIFVTTKEEQKVVNDKVCVGDPSSGQSLRSLMMKKSVNILPNCHYA